MRRRTPDGLPDTVPDRPDRPRPETALVAAWSGAEPVRVLYWDEPEGATQVALLAEERRLEDAVFEAEEWEGQGGGPVVDGDLLDLADLLTLPLRLLDEVFSDLL
jgi:hypothetical protein